MKIISQLVELAKEHHQTLSLANKCINISQNNKTAQQLCQIINQSFANDWQEHFQVEEELIFKILIAQNTPLSQTAKNLMNEHKVLLNMATTIQPDLIYKFGTTLKNHTRIEDREVFPQLNKYLTESQLNEINNHYDIQKEN